MSDQINNNNDQMRTMTVINTSTRCGEIFILNQGAQLHFSCIFCDENFINIQYFTEHLYNNHLVSVTDINLNNTNIIHTKSDLINENDYINIIDNNECNANKEQSVEIIETNTITLRENIILDENSNRPFKCQHCNRGLTSEKHLKNHSARCSQRNFPYKCLLCPRKYIDKIKYNRHIKLEHDNLKKLTPEIILKTTGLKPFKCTMCNKGFLTIKSARCHKTRCQERKIPFVCQFCPRKFLQKIQCDKHERLKHISDIKSDIPYGFWKCKICNRLLSKGYSRKRHEESHSLENRDEKRCSCSLCGKEVSTSTALRVHMRTHSEERPLKCPFCPATFKYSTSLKTHENSHTGERRYQCQYCEKRFLTNTHRKNHEILHSIEKKYECTDCNMKFLRKDYLNSHYRHKHINLHTRPFKCQYNDCNSSFTAEKYLRNHQRLHDNGIQYKCRFCDKKHIVKGIIERHELTHLTAKETMNCLICPKIFNSKTGLNIHMKNKHPNNTPIEYKCGQCDSIFINKGDLQLHIKNICSIALKNYACNMCSSRFITQYGLKVHRAVVHQQEKKNNIDNINN